jgi:pyruvate/2-oxoglutarate dehydrogenase complex dihydrolipoamide dehydrogenase (E3) component
VVVVATGAIPLVPPISGAEREEVATAWDVLRGRGVGHRVLVIGGGITGLETADFLAQQGKEVVVVEQLKRAGADMGASIRWHLMHRLREQKIKIFTSTEIKEICRQGVVITSNGDEETWEGFDTIVLAAGVKPRNELLEEIGASVKEVYVIGDAAQPRKGLEAIREGAEVGRRI